MDNIVAALKCSDRVCHIELQADKPVNWGQLFSVMQQPFPELTYLDLQSRGIDEMVVVPDSFLGGFAPRLRIIKLGGNGVPFPGLPKLLLSATHLAVLYLYDIPHSGYFSPDAMVAALSTLTSLTYLRLRFKSPESCPDLETRRLPPSTRSALPILKSFEFKGVFEYLEDLLTDIDAPQLNDLWITFFNDSVFDMPQMGQFISRTPISSALENAHIALKDGTARVSFLPQKYPYRRVELEVSVLCEGGDWQISSLEQVCTSCLPFLSTLKGLFIHEHAHSQPDRKDNIDNRVWLELLHPFIAVKNLYISKEIAPRIGPALQEGRATEVLPVLENIFLESSRRVQKGIEKFVAARRVSSHPVTTSRWANSEVDKRYYLK